jgi:hypothetical protein
MHVRIIDSAAPFEVRLQNPPGCAVFFDEGDMCGPAAERLDTQRTRSGVKVEHTSADDSAADNREEGFLDAV